MESLEIKKKKLILSTNFANFVYISQSRNVIGPFMKTYFCNDQAKLSQIFHTRENLKIFNITSNYITLKGGIMCTRGKRGNYQDFLKSREGWGLGHSLIIIKWTWEFSSQNLQLAISSMIRHKRVGFLIKHHLPAESRI